MDNKERIAALKESYKLALEARMFQDVEDIQEEIYSLEEASI